MRTFYYLNAKSVYKYIDSVLTNISADYILDFNLYTDDYVKSSEVIMIFRI